MTRAELIEEIKSVGSFLCVGLDPAMEKIPERFLSAENPILEFNKYIIDQTKDYCVAYKPNVAFFEALGENGWGTLKETLDYIPSNRLKIADAKRGDIGNTSDMYAKAFFEQLGCDAITLSPYMGSDSITPYLKYPGKWAIVLCATSNPGGKDFQFSGNPALYEAVVQQSKSWGDESNIMFVVGATRPEVFEKIRKLAPNHFLLVPGVGAQGGSLVDVYNNGAINECGLLVNSSRGIIYSANPAESAKELSEQMRIMLG